METEEFKLPKQIERILAETAFYFTSKKELLFAEVVTNSKYTTELGVDYDNWDGGEHGHAIHLQLPREIYYKTIDDSQNIANTIRDVFNKVMNISNEHFSNVFVELLAEPIQSNWRSESGLLHDTSSPTLKPIVPSTNTSSIWKEGCIRAFFSHKDNTKQKVQALADQLMQYKISGFVAHTGITPTKEWQSEIENALRLMDCLIIYLTEDFQNSDWTDQEVGFALGRNIPVFTIRMGKDPYGFFGKWQGIQGVDKKTPELANEVRQYIYNHPKLKSQSTEVLISAFENSGSWAESERLMVMLQKIDSMPSMLIDRIEQAYKNNSQVRDCYYVQKYITGMIKQLRN